MHEIRRLALETREALQLYIRKERIQTYLGLNPDTLECCCGIASWLLCRHLWRMAGIRGVLVFGTFKRHDSLHCWVELNEQVIDITLTQFEKCEPVEIMPKYVARQLGYHACLRGYEAYDEIRHWEPGPRLIGRKITRFIDHWFPAKFKEPPSIAYGMKEGEEVYGRGSFADRVRAKGAA